jgi:hypothetical protein
MYKAILINPTEKTITFLTTENLSDKQRLIGGPITGVGYITTKGVVGGFHDDFIYANDESDCDETTDFVKIPKYGEEYYRGNILITGSDGQGGEADVKMNHQEAAAIFIAVAKPFLNLDF